MKNMLEELKRDVTRILFALRLPAPRAPESEPELKVNLEPIPKLDYKAGRNELCPCNSGKKFKHCHGKIL